VSAEGDLASHGEGAKIEEDVVSRKKKPLMNRLFVISRLGQQVLETRAATFDFVSGCCTGVIHHYGATQNLRGALTNNA